MSVSPLEEIEAIKQLKARYFRLMDTKDWEAFGECFTEDATVAAAPDPDEVYRGRAEIVARVSGALREATTVHHGHMPEITLDSESEASGIWAMFDHVDLPQLLLEGWGHYHEQYRKVGGAWRIHRTRLTRLRLDIHPKSAEGEPAAREGDAS